MNVSTLHGVPVEGRLTDKLIVIMWHDSGLNRGVSHCPTGGVLVLRTGYLAKSLSGQHIQARFRICGPIYNIITTPTGNRIGLFKLVGYLITLRCINVVSTEIWYDYCE